MNYKLRDMTKDDFKESVQLLVDLELDTREEIEHHLEEHEKHTVATSDGKIIGVVGWYQDNMNYASQAMGNQFPGENVYWVGFFGVEKSWQGKGVGSALIQELETTVKNLNTNQLWVVSVPESVGYYESKGFKQKMTGEISGNPKTFLFKELVQ